MSAQQQLEVLEQPASSVFKPKDAYTAAELTIPAERAAGLSAKREPVATTGAVTPAHLLQLAVQSGADLDRLERLMDLYERWEAAQARNAFNEALAAFKAEAVEILKTRHVRYQGKNGGMVDYWHAELSDVIEAIGPVLSKNGFAWNWIVEQSEKNWIKVTCVLRHRLGHSESVTMGGPPDDTGSKNAIQAIGSTTSYLGRYTLKAVTGVAEKGDDTDGRTPGKPVAPRGTTDDAEFERLCDEGRAKALDGMKALTAWWRALKPEQRTLVTAEFASMRAAARKIDEEAPR